jgi:hypothetical protein
MKRIFRFIFIAAFIILIISGCGGLHYSQIDPEAGNFHPKRIGILPVDVGPYEAASGIVDRAIAEVLIKKRWFNSIVAGDDFKRQYQSNDDLRKVVTDYTEKFKAVNFSDPQLSARIGDLCQIDAFLVIDVEYWNYTTENEDMVGKVGLGIKMIDAATGKVVWKASHYRSEKYLLIKPDLLNVARTLFKEMIGYMPR